MWIKQLIVENFQSHQHTELNFHPGFNVLVGTGNSGKSSLVRALSCILFGTWENSWVRNGAAFCRLTIELDNGTTVVREKGAKLNRYIATVPSLPQQIYENFGTHVPEEIEKLLHIFKAQVGDKEELNLNLSNQLDNLFLLSNPGAYKAKVLGKLSKAHYLDYALKEINKDKKRLSGEKTATDHSILDLTLELLQFADLDSKKTQLETIGSKIAAMESGEERLKKLKALFARVSNWKTAYTQMKQRDTELQNIKVVSIDHLMELLAAVKQLRTLGEKMKRHTMVYENTTTSFQLIEQSKGLISSKYTELLKQNQKCPTCFGNIDDHTCQQILESLNA